MKTKEEFFSFEKEKRKIFDKFYQDNHWICKRIHGKKNKNYDCLIKINNRWWKVEEKFRSKIRDDILVEIMQDINTDSRGWLYETKADILLYGMGNKIYGISIPKLKELVNKYKDVFNKKISKKGWGVTENLVIPLYIIIQNKIGKRIL